MWPCRYCMYVRLQSEVEIGVYASFTCPIASVGYPENGESPIQRIAQWRLLVRFHNQDPESAGTWLLGKFSQQLEIMGCSGHMYGTDCGSTKYFTTLSLTKRNKLFVPMRPDQQTSWASYWPGESPSKRY